MAGKPVISLDHGPVRTTYEPVISTVQVGERVASGASDRPSRSGWALSRLPALGTARGQELSQPAASPRTVARGRCVWLRRLSGGSRNAQLKIRAAAASATRAGLSSASVRRTARKPRVSPPGPWRGDLGVRHAAASVLKGWKLHDGTDFGAACGTAIRAPYAGVVTRAYYSPAYGNRLLVSHGRVAGVQVETAFNHAARNLVRPGQRVTRGQVIGAVGVRASRPAAICT